ncbi:MAG: FAD-dependent oxidoreductase [Cyanobacteria bacterium P01_H01_bin.15]
MVRIAIVGSGVVGAAIAYELSLIPGWEITLLDRNLPADGSTGAALGVLMGIISRKTKGRAWRLRMASMERYPSLLKELTAKGFHVPHNSQGILRLEFEPNYPENWEKLVAFRKTQGYRLEIWDSKQLRAKCHQVDSAVGAIYSPQDFQINPRHLTTALIGAAESNGVTCQFGVEVTDFLIALTNEKQRCDRIITSDGELPVDWVVIAAGLGSLPLTTQLDSTQELIPVLGQAIRVQLSGAIANFEPVISGDDVHIVPLGGGAYWVGATVQFPEGAESPVADSELMIKVWERACQFYPALQSGMIVESWTGLRPRPVNQSAPVLGPLAGYDNISLATGHYRNGVLLAPASAIAIRDQLLEALA